MASMWSLFFWCGVFVGVLVYALILFPLVRWRRQDSALPPQFSQNTPLEVTYTVLPLLMVIGLFVASYRVEERVDALHSDPPLVVDVTGFRWGWRFAYQRHRAVVEADAPVAPQLVLPVDRVTRIELRSVDVIHSFWVPDFLFKRDAIPGVLNRFEIRPDRIGTFRGTCGEFCGLEHAHMSFSVRVLRAADFARWLRAADSRGGPA